MQISGYGDDAIVTVPDTRADGKAEPGSDLDSFEFHFNDSSAPALRQLGESPFKLGGKNLSERLESACFTARKYALELAGLDKNGEGD